MKIDAENILNFASSNNQDPRKNIEKQKNDSFNDALASMHQMNQMSQMGQMTFENNLLANRFRHPYNFPQSHDGFDLGSGAELDPNMHMNMLNAMAIMNMNRNMGMGMNLPSFDPRPELHHENGGHDMSRFK